MFSSKCDKIAPLTGTKCCAIIKSLLIVCACSAEMRRQAVGLGDTRIAYVVKVVRYVGIAAAQIGGRLPIGL